MPNKKENQSGTQFNLGAFLTKVEGLAATAGTNVTITISAAAEDLPEDVKKYL